jgi:hypothetical protein
VVAVPVTAYRLPHTSGSMVVAGHDVVVSPTYGGDAVLRMGPYLPDVRVEASGPLGAHLVAGKTTAATAQEIVSRYAVLASHPDAEIARVREEVRGLVLDAVLRGALVGLVPVALWLLLGPDRRRRLVKAPPARTGIALLVVAGLVALAVEPWRGDDERVQADTWIPLQLAVPEISLPSELDRVEVQGGVITQGTRRLVQSAVDTYDESKRFYADIVAAAPSVTDRFRTPEDGDTVGVLLSDRHDNIGMDPVVATLAKEAGATVVVDAGDDTSTGSTWESFSLDSLDDAFADFDTRIEVAGNHDHGGFVASYLEKHGWEHLDGHEVTPFGDVQVLGVDDPRSSGLGSWLDETNLTFAEVTQRIHDTACRLDAEGRRVSTIVVHSATMALPALQSGCADLVIAGHLHVQVGPDRIVGSNGSVGYRYTNGTTGGAAYGFALGSKLRRIAEFTIVTWRDGRPLGVQPVEVLTTGTIRVKPFVAFDLTPSGAQVQPPGAVTPRR